MDNINCQNVKQFFIQHGLSLESNQGNVKQYTVKGKTTQCSTCSLFKKGRSVTVSMNNIPVVSMETCETNYDTLICLISGVLVALFISVIVVVLIRHKKHGKS